MFEDMRDDDLMAAWADKSKAALAAWVAGEDRFVGQLQVEIDAVVSELEARGVITTDEA